MTPRRMSQIFRISGTSPQYVEASRFAARVQRALASAAGHRAAEPGEGLAELRVGEPGTPAIDKIGPARGEQSQARPARRRIEGQRPLHQNQPGDDEATKENVDALDQERRTVLQLKLGRRGCTQLQHTVAAECARPGHRRPIRADYRRPFRLEPNQDAAAAPDDNRRRELRYGDTNGPKALVVLALASQGG